MLYDDVVVAKPWGKEYLCYRNNNVAIWFLHIEKDQQTSMHCHPNKNTGFVVLEGEVELSLLRNTIPLKALDKIHIFRSRFHSTKAISDGGAFIFEVETPEDKDDLVRLEDAYGREKTAYEGKNFHTPRTEDCLMIPDAEISPKPFMFQGCEISHLKLMKTDLLDRKEEELFIITDGGIVTQKNQNIVWPGDVIDGKSLSRLLNSFQLHASTTMIRIVK
jgi:quercetin dioxygenase-like cupin family protein